MCTVHTVCATSAKYKRPADRHYYLEIKEDMWWVLCPKYLNQCSVGMNPQSIEILVPHDAPWTTSVFHIQR